MNQTISYRQRGFDHQHVDLVQCSIHNWYSAFQKQTFKTRIIELSDTIVTWLIADGVVLQNIEDAVRLSLSFYLLTLYQLMVCICSFLPDRRIHTMPMIHQMNGARNPAPLQGLVGLLQ